MTSRLVDVGLVAWCGLCLWWLSDLSAGVPWWGWVGCAALLVGVPAHVLSDRYVLGR